MEKICTRCKFRTPANRAVCRACGYTKFFAATDVQVAVAKQSAVVMTVQPTAAGQFLIDLLLQTKNSLMAAVEKFSSSAKAKDQKDTAEKVCEDPSSTSPQYTFKDGEDLDSMIAWFKSYGVDRPLILEPKQKGTKAA